MPRESMRTAAARPSRAATKLAVPWRERTGKLSPLKTVMFLGTLAPGIVLAWQWVNDGLGARPITGGIDGTGLWSIRFLLIAFAVTPIRRLADWPRVTVLRRMLGVAAMFYGVAHLCLYLLDQNLRMLIAAGEIARRLYLTIGFVALFGLIVLGWTSTDGWMRKLGSNWKRLHRTIFVLIVLATLHAFMWSKVVSFEAVLMAGLFLWLMLWRAIPRSLQRNGLALVALASVSAIATALIEATWYGTVTSISAKRVLLANIDLSTSIRPAVWVGIVSLGVAVLVVGRQVRHLRR